VPLEQRGTAWRHYYLDEGCLKYLREVEVDLAAAGGRGDDPPAGGDQRRALRREVLNAGRLTAARHPEASIS